VLAPPCPHDEEGPCEVAFGPPSTTHSSHDQIRSPPPLIYALLTAPAPRYALLVSPPPPLTSALWHDWSSSTPFAPVGEEDTPNGEDDAPIQDFKH
jgi:hypothetical protein